MPSETPATIPARPPGSTPRRRLLLDRWTRHLVTGGGLTIIGSILAILFVIAAQVVPLFRAPAATAEAPLETGGGAVLYAGTDEYRELAFAVTATGLTFHSLRDGRRVEGVDPLPLGAATVRCERRSMSE